jgi:site-specific DNA-methyltransferase (adenine-specific)
MGRKWDSTGIAFDQGLWKQVLRVLKPGSYLMAFGGTRTYHRMTCAIEDTGFEIRDCLQWMYGSGFPKSKSCLKPSWEPIVLARKPSKTPQPLNIEEARFGHEVRVNPCIGLHGVVYGGGWRDDGKPSTVTGRWPANTILDESFADEAWSRYFYCAKASRKERDAGCESIPPTSGGSNAKGFTDDVARGLDRNRPVHNPHPTVKPLSLTEHLAKLILPQPSSNSQRRLLVPFSGSGSEMIGGVLGGWNHITGIELSGEYRAIAEARLTHWSQSA